MRMNPLGLASVPADVMNALRVLPILAERLELIASHTENLPHVAEHTSHLADIEHSIDSVSEDTATLRELSGQIAAMDRRMAAIEGAMPVLVEVQQHLGQLPEAIATLQSGIDRLCGLMESLEHSLQPVARVAGRLPGGRNQS